MADRELLALAARAAGHTVDRVADDGRALMLVGVQEPWNPLEDDGDALRLAVKLYLWKAVRDRHQHVDWDYDFCAATRLAIVRAAAEIGRAMG